MRSFPRLGRTMAVAALAVSAVLGACTNSENGEEEEPREDLAVLEELSERSQQAMDHSFSASYMIGEDSPNLVVVRDAEDDRLAVNLGDETHILTSEFTAACEGQECEHVETDDVDPQEWLHDLAPDLLPAEWDVDYWLTSLSTDAAADVNFHDTRLAGQLADCLEVENAVDAPVTSFELCMTTNGVLASLSAVVDGDEVEVKLTSFTDAVDEHIFEVAEATAAPDSNTSNT